MHDSVRSCRQLRATPMVLAMESPRFLLWLRSRDQTHGPFDSAAEAEATVHSLCIVGDEYSVLMIEADGRGSVVRDGVFGGGR
jgi:hypothetical protein